GAGEHADMEQNILPFTLLADAVGHTTAAPRFHFVYIATCFADPTVHLFDNTFESTVVQVGMDNTNQFICTHLGETSFPRDSPQTMHCKRKPGAERIARGARPLIKRVVF